MIFLMLFISCESIVNVSTNLIENNELDAQMMEEIHKSVTFNEAEYDSQIYTEKESLLSSTLESKASELDNSNIIDFLESNNINPIIIEASRFYEKNRGSENIYSMLLSEFELSTKDAQDLFSFIAAIDILEEHLIGDIDIVLRVSMSRDCLEALAATVLTSVGAVFIGGPVGLAFWLVSKGFSMYQLVRACR